MNVDSGGRDPGAARERTELAWWRTTLSVTVVALLFVKLAETSGRPWLGVLGVPGWLVVLAVTHRRLRSAGPSTPGLWLLAVAVAGYALFGVGLVVLP